MKLCKDCKNRGKKRNCQFYTSMSNHAEQCKDFEVLENDEIDFDKMMEILHNAPVSHGYAYDGSVKIKEPSYIISQEDMVKLFNYVRSLN